MTTAVEPPQGTRGRLLDAALELVKTHGFQALTQARVASAAGLRQSHVTYHFPTRTHLLTAVATHCAASTMQLMGSNPCALPPDLQGFRVHIAEHVSQRTMPRMLLGLTLASEEDPSLKNWLAEFEAGVRNHLGAIFTHYGLQPAAAEIALFHASLVGICTLQVGSAPDAPSETSRDLLFAAFDRLVAAARPGLVECF